LGPGLPSSSLLLFMKMFWNAYRKIKYLWSDRPDFQRAGVDGDRGRRRRDRLTVVGPLDDRQRKSGRGARKLELRAFADRLVEVRTPDELRGNEDGHDGLSNVPV